MRRTLAAVFTAVAVLAVPSTAVASPGGGPLKRLAAATQETVMLVVDTSGSMEGSRLDQAKNALNTAVDALDSGQSAGLRSYAGSCGDRGVLRVPIGSNNRPSLKSEINALQAGGGTPTPDALRGAADDLANVTGPKTIVLISDGQSTCGDPCPVAEAIKAEQGVGFKVHTVGFQAPEQAESELACIAQTTGGTYVSAEDEKGLAQAISAAVGGSDCRDLLDFDLSTPEGIADLTRPTGGVRLPFTDSSGAPICIDLVAPEVDNRLLQLTQVMNESKTTCEAARALVVIGTGAAAVFYGGGLVFGGAPLLGDLLAMPGVGLQELIEAGVAYDEIIEESCGLYERSKKELEDYLLAKTLLGNRPTF